MNAVELVHTLLYYKMDMQLPWIRKIDIVFFA